MATAPHVRSKAQQSETDHWLVFRKYGGGLELVKQVEVPRYSRQTADGIELSHEKRLALAVARAVENPRSYLHGARPENLEGLEFAVMTELGADEFEFVEYEKNPAFDGVWDPEDG